MRPGNVGRQKQHPPGPTAQPLPGLVGRALHQLFNAFWTDTIGFFAEPGHDRFDFTCFWDTFSSTNAIKYHFIPPMTRRWWRETVFHTFPGIILNGGRFIIVEGKKSNLTGSIGPELLGRLLDRHAAVLELYARQLCNCPEDAVQEAFVELARQPAIPAEPVPWLYRVVRNKAISASRVDRRHKSHELHAAGQRRAWFEPSSADALDATAAATFLKELAPDEREVVVARIWGGMTFQQIGELIGATDSTAHRRYESALDAIRRKLRISCLKKE
jgi:RNA polymerase sigma factor (sigma-70 family)